MTNHQENEAIDPDLRLRLEALEARRGGGHWWRRAALTMLVAAVSIPFAADALGPVPHSFSSGGVISASEMNANFAHLQNGITANENQVPVGALLLFERTTCPVGWAEVEESRGRALVGLNGSASTMLGTVGDSLANEEDRSHIHSVDVGVVTSSVADAPHTHTVPAATTGGGGEHNHHWWNNGSSFNSSGGAAPIGGISVQVAGSLVVGNYFDVDLYTSEVANHTHSISGRTSGSSTSTDHSHTVDPPSTSSATASTSDVMPYVQVLLCRRMPTP